MPKTRKNSLPDVKEPRVARTHPTQDEIAMRAYEIYLKRRGAPGNALEDWIRAERELLEKSSKPRLKSVPKPIAA
jgi:hypothetical protein